MGKCFWNSVRNVHCSRKEANNLEAKSAMIFNSPATCCVVIGDALQSSIRRARTHRRHAAFVTLVERRHDAHTTVGVLSHQQATCVWAKSAIHPRTNQCNNKPVISRSELEIFLVGFASETMSFWIFGGNAICQTKGGSALFRPNQTPKSAKVGTRSVHGVGSQRAIGNSVFQSIRDCLVAALIQIFLSLYCLVFGWAVMVAINGDSNPQPFGMLIIVCISFPLIFSSLPTRTVFWHVNSFRLFKIFSILSAGRLIHLVEPSKSHPKISFLVDQSPSPCFNFLLRWVHPPGHLSVLGVGTQYGYHAGLLV